MSDYGSFFNRIENIRKSIREERQQNGTSQTEIIENYRQQRDVGKKVLKRDKNESEYKHDKICINDYIEFNEERDEGVTDKVILNKSLGFPNYINVLNSMHNPDIITGMATKFLKGNKYRAKVANQNTEEDQNSVKSEPEEDNKVEDDEAEPDYEGSESESSDSEELPTRYYHSEHKGIRCRNCKEIGHIGRFCPNETKIPLCKFCGIPHKIGTQCSTQICFKCNKGGHRAAECTTTEVVKCSKCKSLGHTDKRCLVTKFNGSLRHVLCTVCNQPGHFSCQKAERKYFHIDFEEESISESDDENLFSSYTLKDLIKDEKEWRNRSQSPDNEDFEFDEEDGIGTNLVNNKQMKKLKSKHKPKSKKKSKYYDFPLQDDKCTESQLHTKYCSNCGKKGHHNDDCGYDDNQHLESYKRRQYIRQRFKNQAHDRFKVRYEDNYRRHDQHDRRYDQHDRRHDQHDRRHDQHDRRHTSNNNRDHDRFDRKRNHDRSPDKRQKRPKNHENLSRDHKREIDIIFKKNKDRRNNEDRDYEENASKNNILDRIRRPNKEPQAESSKDSKKKRDKKNKNKNKNKSSRDYLDVDNEAQYTKNPESSGRNGHNYGRILDSMNYDQNSNFSDNLLNIFCKEADISFNRRNDKPSEHIGYKPKKVKKPKRRNLKQNWSKDPCNKNEIKRKKSRKNNWRS